MTRYSLSNMFYYESTPHLLNGAGREGYTLIDAMIVRTGAGSREVLLRDSQTARIG